MWRMVQLIFGICEAVLIVLAIAKESWWFGGAAICLPVALILWWLFVYLPRQPDFRKNYQ